jgi:hypothetical protein
MLQRLQLGGWGLGGVLFDSRQICCFQKVGASGRPLGGPHRKSLASLSFGSRGNTSPHLAILLRAK